MKLFVVGGGSGLGHEVVKSALQAGYRVGYSTSSSDTVFSKEENVELTVTGCDLRDTRHLDELIAKIIAFSPDRLIICAVRTEYKWLKNTSHSEVTEDINFNVSNIVGIASAYARTQPMGSLTFLLSHICFLYNPGFTLYKTGKDAIDSFAKAIQFEYPSLKVLRVYPGAMKTNFADHTNYSGLAFFAPKAPALWAAHILKKEEGCLIGPVDFLFLMMTRILPFWIQKKLFSLIFQLSISK